MVAKFGPSKIAAVLCFLLTGLSPTLGYKNATAADAVPNPMQGGTKFPQISQVLNVVRLFSPELVAYLQNPKTVCTVIAPTNKANSAAMAALGQYSGLVLQNQSLITSILNYHIIPDRLLKAEDVGTQITAVKTRQGEPMYFVQRGGVPYVASSRVYVQPIQIANIPAGGCIMHIVDDTLFSPPSVQPAFEDWLTKAGNATALQAPKALQLMDLPAFGSTNTTAPIAAASSGTPPAGQSRDSGAAPADSAGQKPQSSSSQVGAAWASCSLVTFASLCAQVLLV